MIHEGHNDHNDHNRTLQLTTRMDKLRLPFFLQHLKKRRRPQQPQEEEVMYFQPQDYDQVIHRWERRPFLKEQFTCFVGEPVGFEYKLKRTRRKIANARARDEEELILSDMVSSKQASVMFSISSDVNFKKRGESIEYLNGYFVSKAFAFRGEDKVKMSEWVEEMDEWVEDTFNQIIEPDKLFVHYPQRPSKDGKTMYVVLFVQLNQSPR